MHNLPQDNTEIVISVVRETLRSANIDVEDIIRDADAKAADIEQKIDTLNKQIESLAREVDEKNNAIVSAQDALLETQKVKVLLEQTQKNVGPQDVTDMAPRPNDEGSTRAEASDKLSGRTASNY